MKTSIYVGCALTHAPQEYRDSIADLKWRLGHYFRVKEFLGLTAGDEFAVYHEDIRCGVGGADIFVAFADYPSTGLGLELGAAFWRFQKPVLLLWQEDAVVTRLIKGIDDYPHLIRKTYKTLSMQSAGKIIVRTIPGLL
ncbi:MAG: hypothetical protein WDZ88_03015 [Candidatus Paceibacterota bacterium]